MKYIDSKTSHLQTKLLSKSIFKNSILLTFTNINHLIIENIIFYEYSKLTSFISTIWTR